MPKNTRVARLRPACLMMFGLLIESLAQSLPEQVCSANGEYRKFRLELPDNPLSVSTLVMEYEDGSLVPMVSG